VTIRLATNESPAVDEATAPAARCAFVNNMPDGAFDATERQFLDLLNDGSGAAVLELRRYTMAGVPRGEHSSQRIRDEYFPLTDIYLNPPDMLIVTGSNPIEERIQDELYWADLVELLTWARKHVNTMLLSCLSAHAALEIFDDIPRVRLPTKCTGVFLQSIDVTNELATGLESEILLPHSRWNTVPHEALELDGYNIIVRSDDTGWGVASKVIDGVQVVLVQGHPEYDPSSLIREYRRDVGRYVRGERDDLPYLPYHCASSDDWDLLERVHQEILEGTRDPRVLDQIPFDDIGDRAPWPWRAMAIRLYANWLSNVTLGKD
jgi:homoserine O-succinyltransferase